MTATDRFDRRLAAAGIAMLLFLAATLAALATANDDGNSRGYSSNNQLLVIDLITFYTYDRHPDGLKTLRPTEARNHPGWLETWEHYYRTGELRR